jgi:hypothetical protein
MFDNIIKSSIAVLLIIFMVVAGVTISSGEAAADPMHSDVYVYICTTGGKPITAVAMVLPEGLDVSRFDAKVYVGGVDCFLVLNPDEATGRILERYGLAI